MAFPQTLTNFVDGTTTITAAVMNALERNNVGPLWVNAVGRGADNTGATSVVTAVRAAIDDLGTMGGTVFFPPGIYLVDATIKVPSRVRILGAGQYATRFISPAGFTDGYIFEADNTVANPDVNLYGQTYGQCFQDFEIRDRNSADTNLTQTGRSEDHHGILIHESDWGQIRNVSLRDLRGYAINMSDVVREWVVDNVYVTGCGDSAESVPAVNIGASTGDASNTIYFNDCRFVFNEGRCVVIDGAMAGIRLINFLNCQIEGGGNGTGGTWGNPWPEDLVWVGRCNDLAFVACEWSNPGAGKFCVNLEGHVTDTIYYASFSDCRFNGQSSGGGIRTNKTVAITTKGCVWTASTAACGDYYVEAASGVVYAWLDNTHSANAVAGSPAGHFRGRLDAHTFNMGDFRLDMPGGGVTSHVAGKPTTNLGLGVAAPNGLHKLYDIVNFLWWERIFIAGIGDLWVPEPGQVVGRRGEQIHSSNTNENSVYTYTIPAGSMSYWGGLALDVWGDFSGTGVGTATLRVKLGGTTVFADAGPALVSGVQPWHVRLLLRNAGAVENAQRLGGYCLVGPVSNATTGTGDLAVDEVSSWSAVQASPAIDMAAADRVLEVTWQHSAAKVTTVRSGRVVWES